MLGVTARSLETHPANQVLAFIKLDHPNDTKTQPKYIINAIINGLEVDIHKSKVCIRLTPSDKATIKDADITIIPETRSIVIPLEDGDAMLSLIMDSDTWSQLDPNQATVQSQRDPSKATYRHSPFTTLLNIPIRLPEEDSPKVITVPRV